MSAEDKLVAFGASLTEYQRAKLHEIHNELGWMCGAASEGMMCCIHTLLNITSLAGEYACANCSEFVVYDVSAGRWHNGTRYECTGNDGPNHRPPPWIPDPSTTPAQGAGYSVVVQQHNYNVANRQPGGI